MWELCSWSTDFWNINSSFGSGIFYYSLQNSVRSWEKSFKLWIHRQWNLNWKERLPPPQMSILCKKAALPQICLQTCLLWKKRHNIYKLNSAIVELWKGYFCNRFDFLGKEDLAPWYSARRNHRWFFFSVHQAALRAHGAPTSNLTAVTQVQVLPGMISWQAGLTWASCLDPEVSYWWKVKAVIILWVLWPLYIS